MFVVRILTVGGWIFDYEVSKEICNDDEKFAIMAARMKHFGRIENGELDVTNTYKAIHEVVTEA